MHGTGTPLGDPIEMGAASAVFKGTQAGAPMALMASKSWSGHAEPAAGLVAFAHAQAALGSQIQLPLLHLRFDTTDTSASISLRALVLRIEALIWAHK